MRSKLGCFLFLIIIMTSQLFAGIVYYVDATNGNDQNNGLSEATAWKTINKVNNSSFSPGDTILFKRGEIWYEMLNVNWSGTDGSPITFGAYGTGNRPIISGATKSNPTVPSRSWAARAYYQHHLNFENLEFQYATSDGLRTNGEGFDQSIHCYDITITNCVSHHNQSHGFKAAQDGNTDTVTTYLVTYTDCQAYNNGWHGFQASDGSGQISYINCISHDNGNCGFRFGETQTGLMQNCESYNNGYGVRIAAWNVEASAPENITIEYCDIYRNGGSGDRCGIWIGTSGSWAVDGLLFRYNRIYENTGEGIVCYQPSNGSEVYYNLIWNNSDGGIIWQPYVSGGDSEIYNNVLHANNSGIEVGFNVTAVIKNNILYYNNTQVFAAGGTWDYNCYYPNISFSRKGQHDISADPLFLDATNPNYHLQSNSPCINAGTNVGLTEDYEHNTVPYGNGVDIGAYEYQGFNPLNANINASPISGYVPLTVNFTGGATGGVLPYSYSWDFGDGTSSSEQIPTHTYSQAGDYTVTLTVTDSQSTQDSDALTINASAVIIPLAASFIASPTSGEVPLTVSFMGDATGGTEPYTYSWDFGDSTSSSEQNPSHAYSNAGDYTVTLTVTDSQSNQDSASLIINASDPVVIPLEASCAASPTSGEVPLAVNFTGSATGGTEPYTYSWDFGDSTSSSEQNPSHTFSDSGDYTVTLTVADNDSNQDSDSLSINVSTPPIQLEASCAASPTSGEVPLTVNFTGNATGGVLPYSYSWDFGDGTSSSEQNPSHIYSQAGGYTVTLTVTDSESNQDNDSLIINASSPPILLAASFTASPISGNAPLTVTFTGSATGGVLPYSYSWDFDDGTSSSEQNPSHIYSQAGDYTAYLTVTDSESNQDNDSVIISASTPTNSAYLSCSPKSLYFGATTSGNETTDQYLRIINAGSGVLTWNIENDADWLFFSPSSGLDRGEITVSVNASGLSLGLYIATITVSSPEAYNSPQYVSVNFRIYEPEQENPPFGSLDTPVDGSTVSGSIPITGWALDDIEVVRLEIKRNSDPLDPLEAIGLDGLVYIGDAVFVEGARPDVEKSYADYPLNSRAGWGYMLLTNGLPYRGNGSFTIYTFAHDAGGHREEIGRKTILCDNINRVKPFGTIDTPEQGEIIRGSDYINFGWALTPLPKTIPKDGSTIWVWVDGVQVGHPVYDLYREDIATLYPEYNNAQGAVGYYYLDTTQYENGVHTIAWSVMDDEGEVDEIGSRYFFIDNIETASVHNGSFGLRSIYREDAEGRLRIGIKEVRRENRPRVDSDREIDTKSILKIQIEEMEPLRIVLEESSRGYMEYIGWGENKWKALPIGSTLDRDKGIFSWIPTPGFIGRYVLHFAVTDGSYRSKPLRVEVNVIPKSCDRELIRVISKSLPSQRIKR